LAFALDGVAEICQFRRDGRLTQEQAEALMTLSTEQGFPFWLASATMLRGWALTEQGQGEEGITQIRQGLDAWRVMGERLYRPHFLALLAEAYGKVGQVEEGLGVLTETLAELETTGQRYCEAELYRVKGELRRRQAAGGGEAEACFHQGLAVARRQQAKSLELRAAMSLARLWQQQGKRAEARELLAPIYGWFTEGFDTADLQEAKTLLEALGE
jgi:predicted ATPase